MRNGANIVIQRAIVSNPLGSILTISCGLSPAFFARSSSESAMPDASSGLPLYSFTASWALRVRSFPAGLMT